MMDAFDTDKLYDLAFSYGGKVIFFLVGLFVTWLAARWLSYLTVAALKKARVDIALHNFLSKIVRWLIITAGVITCLGIFGIQTASFAAILASLGFAVGLALQGSLSNFASGVLLLVFRPFKIGDVVTISGQTGTVAAIDILNTTLDTPDNRRIFIPNSSVFGNQIENISYHSTRRVSVSVGTDYSADLNSTRKTLLEAAKSLPQVLSDPEPAVVLTDLGASSVNWSVRVWVDASDFWPVSDELTRVVKVALDQAEIGIPFPQMDLNFNSSLMGTKL